MNDPSRMWWDEEEARRADAVCRRVSTLRGIHAARYNQVREGYCVLGEGEGLGERRVSITEMRRNRCAEAVDSVVSELCQERPRVLPETTAADFFVRQKAEMQEWYYDAKFESENLLRHQRQLCKDNYGGGLGPLFIVEDSDGVHVEREHPYNVLLDDGGCIGTEPIEVLRERRVSRHVLIRKYGTEKDGMTKKERERALLLRDALKNAPADSKAAGRDVLIVVEAWCEGERHVVAVKGQQAGFALVDEEWPDPVPWAPLILMDASSGWWPNALILRAAPMQGERNCLDEFRQREMECNRTRWIWEQNAIVGSHLDDVPGGYVVSSRPPQSVVNVVSAPAVPQDVNARIREIDAEIFDALLANEMFASGEKPAGLNSGKAQLVYRDSRSRRLRPYTEAITAWHKRVAEELMRAEKRMSARGNGHKVVVRLSGKLQEVPFENLDAGENAMQLGVAPVSALTGSTAFQIELISDAYDRGAITTEQYLSNIPIPNLAQEARLATAQFRLVDMQLDTILRDGVMVSPDRSQPLAYSLRRSLEKEAQAIEDGAPAERIKLIRLYRGQVKAAQRAIQAGLPDIDEPAAPLQPMPPPGGGVPMPPDGLPPVPPGPPGPPPGGGVPMNGAGGAMPPGAPPIAA